MALTKVTGGLISTTSNYEVGVITATKFVGPIEGGVTGITTGSDKIKVIDESSDTTCFPLFATHSDGYLAAKSGSNLTFNSNNGTLTATTFSGALTGNVNGNATGLSGTPSIVVQDITAEMVSVAGTMQYEDVVNVDATGIVTAGGGLVVPANKVVTITGDLNVDGKTDLDDLSVAGVSTFSDDVEFVGPTAGVTSVTWDKSANSLIFKDNSKAVFGTGSDVSMYNATNFHIEKTGTDGSGIRIHVPTDESIEFQQAQATVMATFTANGSCSLYNNTVKRIETSSTGVTVTGEVAASQDYPNYRPMVDWNFAAVKKLDPRITYTRSGPASYTDEFGKVVLVGANTPRFDHDVDTRESKGLLIEESRTNYIKNSHGNGFKSQGAMGDYTSGWVQQNTSNSTITQFAAEGPDGTTSALKYTLNASSARRLDYEGLSTTNGTVYCFSWWMKRLHSGSVWSFQQVGGSGVSSTQILIDGVEASGQTSTYTPADDKWHRVTWKFTKTNTETMDLGGYDSSGNTGDRWLLWGAQLEAGTFPTSYIPSTNGTTTTRGYEATTVEGTEFSDIFDTNFNQFSMVADYDNDFGVGSSGQNYALVDMWGEATGYDDRIEIFRDDASPYHLETRSFGGGSAPFSNGNVSASTLAKTQRFAASWYVPDYSNTSSRRFAISMGGETVDVIADGSGTSVPQVTRLGIGCNPTRLDFTPGRLYFKRFVLYNRTLSDGQLQNLSAQ